MIVPPEILAAYPNAQRAVRWCETILSPIPGDPRDAFAEMRRCNVGLDAAIRLARETVTDSRLAFEVLQPVLDEMDTPDFRRYCGAKLGLM